MSAAPDLEHPEFSIVICTLDRLDLLDACLSSCASLAPDSPPFEIIVVDNSVVGHACDLVMDHRGSIEAPLGYHHEPGPNIAAARNRGVREARGTYIAFLDDDMIVPPDWLKEAEAALSKTGADVLLGLVNPRLRPLPSRQKDQVAPLWFERSFALRDRDPIPAKRNGHLVGGRTCNAFVKISAIFDGAAPFDLAFGRTGGEDTDFLQRLCRKGGKVFYSTLAHAEEIIPPERQTESYLCRREYRGSQNYIRCLRKNDPNFRLSVPVNMAIGAAQSLRAMLAMAIPTADPDLWVRRRVALWSALGKIFWFTQKEPEAYR